MPDFYSLGDVESGSGPRLLCTAGCPDFYVRGYSNCTASEHFASKAWPLLSLELLKYWKNKSQPREIYNPHPPGCLLEADKNILTSSLFSGSCVMGEGNNKFVFRHLSQQWGFNVKLYGAIFVGPTVNQISNRQTTCLGTQLQHARQPFYPENKFKQPTSFQIW